MAQLFGMSSAKAKKIRGDRKRLANPTVLGGGGLGKACEIRMTIHRPKAVISEE